MNMHAAPVRTQAEAALLAAYDTRMSSLPGDEAVAMRRDDAVESLKSGLPTRRLEAWHYTDLRRLLAAVPDFDPGLDPTALAPLVAGSTVLTLSNGRAEPAPALPEGVTASPLDELLTDGRFAQALALQGPDDAIGALNAAFVADGWLLDVATDTTVGAPVEIQAVQGGGQTHVRLPVRVGNGAKICVVERQSGSGAALSTSVSHLTVGDGADVVWVVLQDQPDDATQLSQFNAVLGRDAKLTMFFMNVGGRLVRQEIRVRAAGEDSQFTLRGINLLAGDGHTDVTMVLDHASRGASSTEVVRNVLNGRAHGVFQGRINVHQIAQKTDAKMACNTLLLSDEAEFSTKPELEIFADDVACGHGATVTEIDAGHLFYLMARGIDEKTARGLLVKAFVAEVIEEMEDESLVEALESRLESWFAAHG